LHVIRFEICVDIQIKDHVPTYAFGLKVWKCFPLSIVWMMCVCTTCIIACVRKSNDTYIDIIHEHHIFHLNPSLAFLHSTRRDSSWLPCSLTSFMCIIFSTLTLLLFLCTQLVTTMFHCTPPFSYLLFGGNQVSSFSLLGTHTQVRESSLQESSVIFLSFGYTHSSERELLARIKCHLSLFWVHTLKERESSLQLAH
jgi:hypothetical protein